MKQQEQESPEKKFFDTEQYNTMLIKAEAEEKKLTSLVDLLISRGNSDLKHEALKKLKEHNGLPILIAAITKAEGKEHKHFLIAAVWEAGIDASNYLDFFVDIALKEDYLSTLEAITVIEDMQGPFKDSLKDTIEKIKKANTDTSSAKYPLLSDLVEVLESRME